MKVARLACRAAAFVAMGALVGCTSITQPVAIYVQAPDRADAASPRATDAPISVAAPVVGPSATSEPAPVLSTGVGVDATSSLPECSLPEDEPTDGAKHVETKLKQLGYAIIQKTSSNDRCAQGLKVETVSGRRGAGYAFVYLYETASASTAALYEKGLESAKGAVVQRGDVVYFVMTVPQNASLEAKIALDVAS